MAMFREHVAVGAVISMVVVVAVYFYAVLTDPLLLMFLFGVTIVGSFLPDVDSDSGMPFYLVFGTMTLAATGVVLLYTLNSTFAADWRYLTGIPAAALFVFWFIVGGIVKRCTHHRGIFHSLPALAIAGLGACIVSRYYGIDEQIAWIFGGGMAVGYLSHLILDELHAGITLDGIPFNPKSSFGSALKLFSRSSKVNLATYLLLAVLAYSAFTTPALAFYNDSDVIEIIDDAPPTADPNGGSGSSGGTGGGTGGAVIGGDAGDSGSGATGGTGGGSQTGSGDASGTSGSDTGDDSNEGEISIEDENELFDFLLEEGVVSGSGLLDDSALDEISASTFSLTLDGDRLRSRLSKEFDLKDLLQNWRAQKNGALSGREYGLIAASTALRDGNVQSVSFTASTFEIVYRSRGYLFGIFPKTFPVRVMVIPTASSGRVTVKLPWYRFFVREFFTPEGLAEEIDDVIQAQIEANTDAGADLNAPIFEAIALFLKRKVGTIADSVNLGTTP